MIDLDSDQFPEYRDAVNEIVQGLGYTHNQTNEAYAALSRVIHDIIGTEDIHSQILYWESSILDNAALPTKFISYSRDILLPKVREWRRAEDDVVAKLEVYRHILEGDEDERGLMPASPEERKMFIDVINS